MISWIGIIFLFIAGGYLIAVLEHWSLYRAWDVRRPLSRLAALLLQEDILPEKRDKIFYESAPVLFILVSVLALGTLPFAKNMIPADLATGALFINAMLAYIMVSLLMAGWAPNGVYAMIGGWRFLGQLIAYSMPVVMAITATVMRAESMNMIAIVESQESLWNILYQPIGFVLFYVASLALTFLPPFDLPDAPGELAEGVFGEFTGKRLLAFRVGRIVLILTLSLAVSVFFLGGWYGPWLPPVAWTFIKTIGVAASFFLAGEYFPRIRHDHTLEWSWKFATPAALLNILWVGILLLL